MKAVLLGMLAVAVGGVACRRAPAPVPALSEPVITRLVPDRGPAEEAVRVRVAIHGVGFALQGNVVRFGGVAVAPLSESDTLIVFDVPKVVPSQGEVPPMVFTVGQYPVVVEVGSRSSRPLPFVLTP